MGQLDGRVAVVTGAGRHLGRAYALGLAAQGAAVVAADIIDAAPVAAEITEAGGCGRVDLPGCHRRELHPSHGSLRS